ncbi:hereditary hemochromatosis protein homolog isoform X3 [Hypanus sabinus]|uniref:hereditary hemochromatosis protein homolog isoform X3 n=1 Tax=Hypanus sabinus TaxID=79690 RepID=UPI0028C4D6F4|nr:hereditary hemochromatosis protein homolog isoform X3 [Hypanus sabinus]
MVGLLLLALLCGGVSAGSHSLRHFYTAVTPGSGVPEFMAVGYVDEEQIIYYDSVLGQTVPRQQWMAESQGPDYWERETQISRSHEQWAQAKTQTLMMRTNQTGGIHFLQRIYGCELRDDGTTTGFNWYGWDGSDFISFDKDRMVWVTPVPWGVITKDKWDRNTAMNQDLKGYLEQECIEWVKRYVRAGESHLQPNPPEVSFTASKDNRLLSCVATGFYPQTIDVTILWNGRTLEETHSHGILPNHDHTYQLTRTVQVEPTDTAEFSCQVEHRGLPEPLVLLFGSHSLRHFYTAVTPGSGVPEFTAVRYVDDLLISYYDSVLGRTVPRQQWMAESQGPDYWERETQISRSHEQWAQAKIQTLMMRTNQTGGIHFLQRIYGCELRDDGTTTGFNWYGWDGSDFISFDKDRMVWVTPVPWGVITKDKWDRNTAMNQDLKGYLEQECIEWVKRYVRAGESHLQPNPPEVSFTASKDGSLLSCVATGFYPQSIDVTILRNGRFMEETHSHGILPNHDNTYQLTRTVQVEPTDTAEFSCRVEHRGLPEPLVLLFASDKGESSSNSSALA